MHLYLTTIGTWYAGVVAAHSEDEAVETALRYILPNASKRSIEYEKDVAWASLINVDQIKKPRVIV
ncbi:hypothetical protein [Limosilactobacillus fermentum]|uniref:hypothetical protein n=1 Tax=Limosilactobacillus fermentum TaxID=1613 RepID=UPI001E2B80BC|nr:hypothetical protein [Limosilactobacillus fermentum]MCD5422948.1 hypothetical protein [Limosilactobacillus fermentum]